LGIQPKTNEVGEIVTPEVLHAVNQVTQELVETISSVATSAGYS
jgi:hypothetical protein